MIQISYALIPFLVLHQSYYVRTSSDSVISASLFLSHSSFPLLQSPLSCRSFSQTLYPSPVRRVILIRFQRRSFILEEPRDQKVPSDKGQISICASGLVSSRLLLNIPKRRVGNIPFIAHKIFPSLLAQMPVQDTENPFRLLIIPPQRTLIMFRMKMRKESSLPIIRTLARNLEGKPLLQKPLLGECRIS